MVSNKHFLGVINLYAKVTLGFGMAASIPALLCTGLGMGQGQHLEQAADTLCPSHPTLYAQSCTLLYPSLLPCPVLTWAIPSSILYHIQNRHRLLAYWILVLTQQLKTVQ